MPPQRHDALGIAFPAFLVMNYLDGSIIKLPDWQHLLNKKAGGRIKLF